MSSGGEGFGGFGRRIAGLGQVLLRFGAREIVLVLALPLLPARAGLNEARGEHCP